MLRLGHGATFILSDVNDMSPQGERGATGPAGPCDGDDGLRVRWMVTQLFILFVCLTTVCHNMLFFCHVHICLSSFF